MNVHHSLQAVLAAWNVVLCPDHGSWLAARCRYLTASDVAGVLGLHPHKSRTKVVAEKQAAAAPGYAPGPEPRVDAMRAGHFLEEGVFRWFLDDVQFAAAGLGHASSEVVGMQCRNPEGASLLVAHPDESLGLAASPDCLLLGPGEGVRQPLERAELVEVKVHGPEQWRLWDAPLSRERHRRAAVLGVPRLWLDQAPGSPDSFVPCPLQHWVQLQTQLLCTGVQRGWVVGNCGSQRRAVAFEADRPFQAAIEQATRSFWADVRAVPAEETTHEQG